MKDHLRTRIHALDGLRAIAASLVLVHHLTGVGQDASLSMKLIHSATASGVELFFVLSGAVLGRQFIMEGRPLFLGQYFFRRVERLWPPYLVAWLLAGMAIAITTAWPTWWSLSAWLPRFTWSDWLAQMFIVNWWSPPYAFAWWSLTVEVAFYGVLPFLIPLFKSIHRQPVVLLSVLCGAAVLSLGAYNKVSIPVVRDLINYAPCFVAGLILASHEVSARFAWAALLSGVALIISYFNLPSFNPHVGWGLIYLGVVAFAMDRCSHLSSYLSFAPLVWLGERSYSLFLTHHTVIVMIYWLSSLLIDTKGIAFYLVTRVAALAASIFIAMITFSFVERRFAKGLVTADQFWPPLPLLKWLELKH